MNLQQFESDTVQTETGDLVITFIGHGSLALDFNRMTIQVDPYSRMADYSQFSPADLIFITHDHSDHFDLEALNHICSKNTTIILTESCTERLPAGTIMRNGEEKVFRGIPVKAVPAYNIEHKRENGQPFHPKGSGNGYVFSFGRTRIYVAGDTENIPEMKELTAIDIAFLPMNLPYTMTPEMVADCARIISPRLLYPYHFGGSNTKTLVDLLAGTGIEVRIRRMA